MKSENKIDSPIQTHTYRDTYSYTIMHIVTYKLRFTYTIYIIMCVSVYDIFWILGKP